MLDSFWTISESLFKYIQEILPEGKTILELGSGNGTKELVKYYNVFSIEHDEKWINHVAQSKYIYAPLKKHKVVKNYEGNIWYDVDVLKQKLPSINYDLLLIDGPCPPGHRTGFVKYLNLFKTDVPMIFDDVNRPRDYRIVLGVQTRVKKDIIIPFNNNEGKCFAVINGDKYVRA